MKNFFDEPSLANAFQERIITERDGRMVTPVKFDFKGLIKGIEHDRSSVDKQFLLSHFQ